jgi:hypothetical protein
VRSCWRFLPDIFSSLLRLVKVLCGQLVICKLHIVAQGQVEAALLSGVRPKPLATKYALRQWSPLANVRKADDVNTLQPKVISSP